MIIPTKSGAQIVIGEMPWIPGCYLSIGNLHSSQGAVLDPKALDQVIEELGRVRAVLVERLKPKQRRRRAA